MPSIQLPGTRARPAPRLLLAFLLAATVLALTAAPSGSQQRACTQIGCSSGIYVDLADEQNRLTIPRRARVTLCMDDACRRFPANSAWVRLDVPSQDDAGPVRIRIVVRSRAGRVLMRRDRTVTLTRSQPNGPECEPVCWQASFAIRGGYRLARTG